MQWFTGAIWRSDPPALTIMSDARGVIVESLGRILLSMELTRPHELVIMDDAIITRLTGDHYERTTCTPTAARTWAGAADIVLEGKEGGAKTPFGEQLVAAWDDHERRYRAARAG